ncbi:hypothetical protein GCM10010260_58320 [Streptomyces filipinensis]|uniref:Uncharacterized protein n=1 Tax=Streptomyces filipinensis TaxID=66887 RepID=A0A918IG25_9ACTN|nr:hypothetical protein GCM10010260_58320 [Streptomyces filipinensis]
MTASISAASPSREGLAAAAAIARTRPTVSAPPAAAGGAAASAPSLLLSCPVGAGAFSDHDRRYPARSRPRHLTDGLSGHRVLTAELLTDAATGIQARIRAGTDPREVDPLDDQVHAVLHGSGPHTFGAVPLRLVYRLSAVVIGADSSGRWERTSNYYAHAHRMYPNLE